MIPAFFIFGFGAILPLGRSEASSSGFIVVTTTC